VVVSLSLNLRRNARLLQEIIGYGRTNDVAGGGIKRDLDEFAKPRRVVVAESSRITERFQQWIRRKDPILQRRNISRDRRFAFSRQSLLGDSSQILHDNLGRFRLTRTTLSTNDNALIANPSSTFGTRTHT